MGKKEVRTSDGLHLDGKQACEFGKRVADRLNEQMLYAKASSLLVSLKSQFVPDVTEPVTDLGSLPNFAQR